MPGGFNEASGFTRQFLTPYGAEFVELPGDDHLPFVGDQDAIVREIHQFIAHTQSHQYGSLMKKANLMGYGRSGQPQGQ